MKKNKIKEQIYSKSFEGDGYNVRGRDLPADLQPDDIIHIIREEAYYSENNSYDAYTELVVEREREETDAEYEKRIEGNESDRKRMRELRYQNYLKLKAEFEGIDFETIKNQ